MEAIVEPPSLRLPEAKIKAALLNPETIVREEVLRYFTDAYSRDPEVMPIVIQAVEKCDWNDPRNLDRLAQTQATVGWAIRQLHQLDDSLRYSASNLLSGADLRLVAPRREEILKCPGLHDDSAARLRARLDLQDWSAERCWAELEAIAAKAARNEDGDVDYAHASRVVEALARQGEAYVDRVLTLLAKEVEVDARDPMMWLEIFLVELAGEMRLESALPLIVGKLREPDAEVLWEETLKALAKIGTDDAAAALAEGWADATPDYHLYAAEAMGKIHSDTTVRKCLELLPAEKDIGVRTNLADALLTQFSNAAIEPVREIVSKHAYDGFLIDLKERLVVVSTILDVSFPEYPIWKRDVEQHQKHRERQTRDLLASWQSRAKVEPAPARLPPIVNTEKRVGRNDPCPCGSGKKYKKCCMSRE